MQEALLWWLLFLLLGLTALPITLALFRNLPDRGYAFARPVGLLLFSYVFWLLGLARILPNSQGGAAVALIVVAAVSLWVHQRRPQRTVEFVRRRWGLILATEAVFAAVFAAWAVFRSYTPAIAHTEQPMDFALLNGVLGSPHFPPNDPWFSGQPISYYYFGYFMQAALIQLTGIASSVGYNLALASTAAMAAAGAFSLVCNVAMGMRNKGAGARKQETGAPERQGGRGLGGVFLAGLLGVLLLLFIGNLVGFLEYLAANNAGSAGFWRWVSIDGLKADPSSATWYPSQNWFWWRSTRVINSFVGGQGVDYTITEFPFFSFLLGDLHPHVMALPFVVTAMALAYNALRSRMALGLSWLRSHPWEALMIALAIGSLGFLNSWDLPTLLALFLAAAALRYGHVKAAQGTGRVTPPPKTTVPSLAAAMAIIAAAAFLLYLPFYVNFHSQASGILPVRRNMTRPLHYALIWGPFLVLTASVVAALAWREARAAGPARWLRGPAIWAFVLPLLPFVLWALAELGMALAGSHRLLRAEQSGAIGASLLAIGSRFWHILPLLVMAGLALLALFRKAAGEGARSAPLQFALLLIAFGLLLTMGPELFYISDFFGNRMNTVFKFYYQAWAVLAVAAALCAYWWAARPMARFQARLGRAALLSASGLVIAAAFLYVPPALYSKDERFRPQPTLDALAMARQINPAEAEAVQWLRDHAPDTALIVEASPDSGGLPTGDYDPSVSRISQQTGLPTILGWPGHEHQWRGDPFSPILQRHRDVQAIYTEPDLGAVQRLLDQYQVTYVVVGGLERRSYGLGVAQRFNGFMDIAFQNQDVVVYVRRPG